MNDKFSMSRLMSLFVYDWATTKKVYIIFASLILGPIIIGLMLAQFGANSLAEFIVSLIYPVIIFGALYVASHTFSNIRKKSGSISFLMLPASNIEKFIVRVVNMTVVPLIVANVTWFVADVIVYLASFVLPCSLEYITLSEAYSFIPEMYNSMQCGSFVAFLMASFVLVTLFIYIMNNMLYMSLCSLMFKRFVFVKAIFLFIGLCILFSSLFSTLFSLDFVFNNQYYETKEEVACGIISIFFAVNMILLIGYILFSFFICKRKQVTSK